MEGTKCRSVGPTAVGGDQSVRAVYGTAGVQKVLFYTLPHVKGRKGQYKNRIGIIEFLL